MASPNSLQGRRLEAQTFPSPAHVPATFSSVSRCLIDLGTVLVVLTEGSNDGDESLAYQRMLFRLELPGASRHQMTFADDSQLSILECEAALKAELDKLPNCQIVGLRFPFFDKGSLHKTKYRPCVALWGDEGAALYLSIYMGAPRASEAASYPWEIIVKGPEDLAPASAAMSVVDVSKLCGMPEIFHRPGDQVDGKTTYQLFYTNNTDDRTVLSATDPIVLRQKIIDALISMLQQNPLSYVDATQELDQGAWIESLELIDNEWCIGLETYCGTPVGIYDPEVPLGQAVSHSDDSSHESG